MRRYLPNIITSLRIAAIPALGWLTVLHEYDPFAMLLVACLVGDVVDGAIARTLRATTALGAQLDSIADTLLFVMTVAGTLVFHPAAVREHVVAFGIVAAAWLAENVVALVRYGRLSSFHTWLSRIAGVAMGAFVVVLFLRGLSPVLFYAAVALALLATLEEFVLMWMLPTWTANVRGVCWMKRRGDLRT